MSPAQGQGDAAALNRGGRGGGLDLFLSPSSKFWAAPLHRLGCRCCWSGRWTQMWAGVGEVSFCSWEEGLRPPHCPCPLPGLKALAEVLPSSCFLAGMIHLCPSISSFSFFFSLGPRAGPSGTLASRGSGFERMKKPRKVQPS